MGVNNKLAYLNYEGLEKYHSRLTNLLTSSIGTTYVTYSQLLNLVNSNLLIPGKKYRIIDFASTGRYGWVESPQGHFDIIVTASNPGSLESRATAAHALNRPFNLEWKIENWELTYELKNDPYRTGTTLPYTGSITWMKDEYGNEAPIDFKNLTYTGSYLFSYVNQNGTKLDLSTLQKSDPRFKCQNNKIFCNLSRFNNIITADYSETASSTIIENNNITNSMGMILQAVEANKVMSCSNNVTDNASSGGLIRGNNNKVGLNSLVYIIGDNNTVGTNNTINLTGSNNVIRNNSSIRTSKINNSTISQSVIDVGSNISSSTIKDTSLPKNTICWSSNIEDTYIEYVDSNDSNSIEFRSSVIKQCDFYGYLFSVRECKLHSSSLAQDVSRLLRLNGVESISSIINIADCYDECSISGTKLSYLSSICIESPVFYSMDNVNLNSHSQLDIHESTVSQIAALELAVNTYLDVTEDIENKVASLDSLNNVKLYNIADLVI